MTIKPPDATELNALAIEACDMWQEHLSTLATDQAARAELTRFLEPQRRLFADWVAMMQAGASAPATPKSAEERHDTRQREPASTESGQPAEFATSRPANAPVPPSRGDEYGDDALRVAQLAYRVAELEKRVAQLESLIADGAGSSRRAQRATS